jgi:hypothetical protein
MPSKTPERIVVGSDGSHEECNPQWFVVPDHTVQEALCQGSHTLFPETKLLPAVSEQDRRFGTTSAPVKIVCEVCDQQVVVFEL